MKIVIATPEAVPFIKTGGLADVTGSLLKEYLGLKEDACIILPLYKKIRERFELENTGLSIKVNAGDNTFDARIFSSKGPGPVDSVEGRQFFFIECDRFFDRDELYGTAWGDYPDNALRFIFFSRAVMETCRAINFRPDVIHCNDWQTGLIPLYLKTTYANDSFFEYTSTLFTIHNLGYQGIFPASDLSLTGLGNELFDPEGIEFYGNINFMKAGLISADVITTVSGNYASEILNSAHGFGLDGVLRKRQSDLSGIINGIDHEEWNPLTDKFIKRNYSIKNARGKKDCKLHLIRECFGDDNVDIPVLSIISRLSGQKGLDLVLNSLDDLLSTGLRLIVLGRGDENFQARLLDAARKYKGSLFLKIGFDEAFGHRIYAGSDIFLMPSLYEPCGLGQLIALKYGTVPVARRTGGLADTIDDYEPLSGSGSGFLFSDYSPDALNGCIRRALCVYVSKDRWGRLIKNAMGKDFSWRKSATRYLELYKKSASLKRQ